MSKILYGVDGSPHQDEKFKKYRDVDYRPQENKNNIFER
jgi:hypothetical protein